jgi:trehalose-6-phosphate synthase
MGCLAFETVSKSNKGRVKQQGPRVIGGLSIAPVVNSLHDGMNLVAKEFVAARDDLRGVLALSRFTGAALELTDALLIFPFAMDEFAEALRLALVMPEAEQERRMRRMRQQIADNNIYR